MDGTGSRSCSDTLEASAQCSFRTQNPGAPLPLRAGVEAEDAIAVACREVIPAPGPMPGQNGESLITWDQSPPALKPI